MSGFPFVPDPLPYSYEALEPVVSREIMKLHYERHYKGYITKSNQLLLDIDAPRARAFRNPVDAILRIGEEPGDFEERFEEVLFNLGGASNHAIFWRILSPEVQRVPGALERIFRDAFGSFREFASFFKEQAASNFIPGWTWLAMDRDMYLHIVDTPDQSSPFEAGLFPVFGIDLWEHAYYLQYFNDRRAYVEALWSRVHWEHVLTRMTRAVRFHEAR